MLSQALMETEVSGVIGAERHQRTDERATCRNGYRTRTWDTLVGEQEDEGENHYYDTRLPRAPAPGAV